MPDRDGPNPRNANMTERVKFALASNPRKLAAQWVISRRIRIYAKRIDLGEFVVAYRLSILLASSLTLPAPCLASDWKVAGAGNGHGETMVLAIDPARSYIFECTPNAVAITLTGVTDLLNIRDGGKVADAPGSVMPEGAAMMALFTGKGEPDFLPADYKPNPVKGWDLTLRLAKNDKSLKGLEKTEMLSLFTTGFTAANVVDAEARAQFSGFLARCRG